MLAEARDFFEFRAPRGLFNRPFTRHNTKQRSYIMLEITQSTDTPTSSEPERLNSKWERIAFHFHKRAFLSKLQGILNAAAGHEANLLPSGNYQYRVLSARADSLCAEFAERWGLDLDLLKARIPGLAKLAALSLFTTPMDLHCVSKRCAVNVRGWL